MKTLSCAASIFASIAESALRFTSIRAPISLVYLYLIGLCFVFTLVVIHIPIAAFPDAPHDDGLYITLGRSLAEGNWLGSFSQFTLMKGPGYPAFLAMNNWLGLPISLSHAVFHCFAVTFFVVICQRVIKSHLISAVFFALLLWHPVYLSDDWLRVLRDKIYPGQTLLVLGFMLLAIFGPARSQHRHLYAALAGAFLVDGI